MHDIVSELGVILYL